MQFFRLVQDVQNYTRIQGDDTKLQVKTFVNESIQLGVKEEKELFPIISYSM